MALAEAPALRLPLKDRVWNSLERVAPIPSPLVRATRFGAPRLAETFIHPSRTRTLFQAGKNLLQEARKEDTTSVVERFLAKEENMAYLFGLLSALKFNARRFVSIVAPEHAKHITARDIDWSDIAKRALGRHKEDGEGVPDILLNAISPEFYARAQRVVGEKVLNIGVGVLGLLEEDRLKDVLMGLNHAEEAMDQMSEAHKDVWTKLQIESRLAQYIPGLIKTEPTSSSLP